MIINHQPHVHILKSDELQLFLLSSGDVARIMDGDTYLNQLLGNHLDGSVSNIYMQLDSDKGRVVTPLIGVSSPSKFSVQENQVVYIGTFEHIDYVVTLSLVNSMWFFDVKLSTTDKNKEVTLIYVQDVAIAHQGAVRNNEAYTSQYIDHKVFHTDFGFTICSRQNQSTPHYLEHGCLTKTVGYSTDGYQFYGLDYKETNVPVGLLNAHLANDNYQYEFALAALQTEKVMVSENPTTVTFYAAYQRTHEAAINESIERSLISKAHQSLNTKVETGLLKSNPLAINLQNIFTSKQFTNQEIDLLFPKRHNEEKNGHELVSFFLPEHQHVVLQAKEKIVERTHASIVTTGNNRYLKEEILAATTFMNGVFFSQVVSGNSSFTKLNSNVRNGLNVQKLSGSRLMVKRLGHYALLGLPAAYEMGVNYAKWYYKVDDDVLLVTTMTTLNTPELLVKVESTKGYSYDLLWFHHLVLGAQEYENSIHIEQVGNSVYLTPEGNTFIKQHYPEFHYTIHSDSPYQLNDDRIFYEDGQSHGEPVLTMQFNQASSVMLTLFGSTVASQEKKTSHDLDQVKKDYYEFYQSNLNDFQLHGAKVAKSYEKLNDVAYWYTNNALIHYSSPHGLEQYSGAAWGLRDVCQGPFEYFMATQQFDVAKDILLKVFANQFLHDGNWPQWFMFDRFYRIRQHDSHGDIIVWPLRSLANYLYATGDLNILKETCPYFDLKTNDYTMASFTILDHVKKEVEYITSHFMPGTALSNYGEGDWDDTLQPVNAELRNQMVSGWTVALTYEAIHLFATLIHSVDTSLSTEWIRLANQIKHDFQRYVIVDGIPAGFLRFTNEGILPIIHPLDQTTGMKYRLLPFNRGMIAQLFTLEQVQTYRGLIKQHLGHSDGVRLMDHTVKYHGGTMEYFKRAETAANFGREIGLQYVHAHIRYIEAMAMIGDASEAWNQLMKIVPIQIQETVPNAMPRQSNMYFSSSDGNFKTRYEAMANFDLLRTGQVGVKGGWRLYSSGPGIFLNVLITKLLGIRTNGLNLEIDPIMDATHDQMTFTFILNNRPALYHYHVIGAKGVQKVLVNNHEVEFTRLPHPYRLGGVIIPLDKIHHLLKHEMNEVDIYL